MKKLMVHNLVTKIHNVIIFYEIIDDIGLIEEESEEEEPE